MWRLWARGDELRLKDFRLPAGVREDMTGMPGSSGPGCPGQAALRPRPRVDPEKCVGCGGLPGRLSREGHP